MPGHKLRQFVLPLISSRGLTNIKEATDHEIALRQLMERVVMAIDNAKFIKRNWVVIDWELLHWTHPQSGRSPVTPAVREAIRVALIARGYQVKSPLRAGKKIQTTIRWGGF